MEWSNPVSTHGTVQAKPRFNLRLGRAIAPVIATVLGLSSGVWLVEAIAPQAVHAQTNRVNLSLQRQPNESFENFISRAEAAARATAQQNFTGSATSDVSVTVIGESAGLIAPLLSLEVSRDNWRSRPDPQQWATYYSDARVLLGFDSLAPATAEQPTPTTSTEPTATDPGTADPGTADPGTAQTPTTAPGATPGTTILIPPAVQVSPTQPVPSGTPIDTAPANTVPGEPQQAPGTTGTQPGANTPTQQPAGQTEGAADDSQQPALGDPSVGNPTNNVPPTQNETQQPELGDPSVGDQTPTGEAPQTEVDTPGSIPAPGRISVPEVFDPGPIGVPRSGVNN